MAVTERAVGMLRMASMRIAGDHPFHAHLLARFALTPSMSTTSIGLRVHGLRLSVDYNPDYVAGQSVECLEALLLHIVNHVIFGHPLMQTTSYPDGAALLVAQEVTANEWVGRNLPAGSITLDQFPRLPPGEDTVTRYGRLFGQQRGRSDSGKDGEQPNATGESRSDHESQQDGDSEEEGSRDGDGASSPDDDQSKHAQSHGDHDQGSQEAGESEGDDASGGSGKDGGPPDVGDSPGDDGQVHGEPEQQGGRDGPGGGDADHDLADGQEPQDRGQPAGDPHDGDARQGSSRSRKGGAHTREPTSVDDHAQWQHPGQDPDEVEAAVQADVRSALKELNEKERASLSAAVRGAIATILDKTPGSIAGGEQETLAGGVSRVDWKVALRRFVGSLPEREVSYARPPRRAPNLVGIVPGVARLPGRLSLVVAIDTSGSMTAEQLAMIAAELRVIARRADITIIECDVEIQTIFKFSGELTEVHGRGGTDLRPPFGVAASMRHDALVYFTDGFGPVPDAPPRSRVLWCLTSDGQRPAPWGHVAWMPQAR
jgi:predicted metal-dependent peptidase